MIAWAGRLASIGASERELELIDAAYTLSAPRVQADLDRLIGGIANADLALILAVWRLGAGPFAATPAGAGLPFGTRVAILTGDPADDGKAISAGTGVPIALS